MEITPDNVIKTSIDPKDFLAKYGRITVLRGEFEIDAYTEIFDDSYDPDTKVFTFKVGLQYPSLSTNPEPHVAKPVMKDGKLAGVHAGYVLTQKDFDALIKGEKFRIPAR